MNTDEIAEILLRAKAVTLNVNAPYTYSSGMRSPIYCDTRLLISYPSERNVLVSSFLDILKDIEFDVIAGTSTAGIPWAAWIAEHLKKPMIYVRSKTKGHGKQNKIEGKLEPNKKVVVIEDLVTTGGSSVSAVEAVREAGGEVNHCVAIITYGLENAKKRFQEAQCALHTLTTFEVLLKVAADKQYLTTEEKDKALQWNKEPDAWAEKMGLV